MRILLASPFFSQHFDAGHFWAKAFSNLGHSLVLWDYRLQTSIPVAEWDLAIVLKGDPATCVALSSYIIGGSKAVCYWPDAFERSPHHDIELYKSVYSRIFTPVCPTPEDMVWLPTGWDEDIHKPWSSGKFQSMSVFIGTYSERKEKFLKVIRPSRIYGNDWSSSQDLSAYPPVYLHDFTHCLSAHGIAINIHRDNIGVNRRLFEFIACTPTITDRVPGVAEILGKDLADRVSFSTPEEGAALKEIMFSNPDILQELWKQEREAIKPYTYISQARKILDSL